MPTSFADLGVPADLVAALARRSITEPFPIQALTLADGLAGRDLCAKAPTGSGKTLAFGITAIARLTGRHARPKRPLVLVLTPTRELCAQVASELATLATPRDRKVASFYGGVGYGAQTKALARGCDVAVACPGRLTDLIEGGHVRLDEVETVVIDEADRMADMGFLPAVRKLLDQTPGNRQTLLFSATLDGDIDVLVRNYQRDPARHEFANSEDAAAKAHHVFWKVSSTGRIDLTADITAAAGPTIVFSRTKHGADRISRQLIARGIRSAAIHGDRTQGQRERALAAFANGAVETLVATDVAARGIHVDGVSAVVHFDPPADSKDYVHRSGRTARAGALGVVVSFVTPDKADAVRKLQRDLGVPSGAAAPDLAELAGVLGIPDGRIRPLQPPTGSDGNGHVGPTRGAGAGGAGSTAGAGGAGTASPGVHRPQGRPGGDQAHGTGRRPRRKPHSPGTSGSRSGSGSAGRAGGAGAPGSRSGSGSGGRAGGRAGGTAGRGRGGAAAGFQRKRRPPKKAG